jgi:hypothetical protein
MFFGIFDSLVDGSTLLALPSHVGTETVALFNVCDSTLSAFSLFSIDFALSFYNKLIHVAIWKMKIIIISVVTRRN